MKNVQTQSSDRLGDPNWTSMTPEQKSIADLLCSLPRDELETFLNSLTHNALMAMPWLFDLWAHPHQKPPEGDWKTWVLLGGRGAGKTRAGAEWVRSKVEGARPTDKGQVRRIALVAETLDQAREVMIFGESGIMAATPPDRRPDWQASRKRLVWPNGAIAHIFSGSDPEALRGPQFDCAWVDELAKWKSARKSWDMLQFALRLGDHPQQVVTTTPRDVQILRDILDQETTVQTSAPTLENRAYLTDGFAAHLESLYGGTRLGRQELDGELLSEFSGALWARDLLDAQRCAAPDRFDRIVVAVDPPVTAGDRADECGIVVAGVEMQGPPVDWRAYVLEDASMSGATTQEWARRAINLYHRFGADRLVAEVNQGGDLVADLLRQNDPLVSYSAVRATRGKAARAEPVAALYEQGRVFHAARFDALETQMCSMTLGGYQGRGSPDRVDALVWALTELMITPAASYRNPTIRSL